MTTGVMRGMVVGVIGAAGLVPTAPAVTILGGTDYLTAVPGTFINFGIWGNPFGIGGADFMGDPAGPGTADTIIVRLGDLSFERAGDTGVVAIELGAFSLRSTGPVDVGGTFYDLVLGLDSASPSTGQMAITLDDAETPSGTFVTFLEVFLELALLDPASGVAAHTAAGLSVLELDGSGRWTGVTTENTAAVSGATGTGSASTQTGLTQGFFDFYMEEVLFAAETQNDALHLARTSIIPEPGTASLFVLGALGMGITRRWRWPCG